MLLYKVDTQEWTVKSVQGERYPGVDSDGDACFSNTHFEDENEAWNKLEAEAKACLSLASRDLASAKMSLQIADTEVDKAAAAMEKVNDQLQRRAKL